MVAVRNRVWVGFQNCHVATHFTGAPKCTGNRYVLEIAVSAPWCTCTTLSGVECQNSSGAEHRSCSGTKLNAGSRLHYPYRSRGLYPGCKLPGWLLRGASRILVRTPTDPQRGSNLLGLRRLEKVLKVTVFREDIVECFLDNIV